MREFTGRLLRGFKSTTFVIALLGMLAAPLMSIRTANAVPATNRWEHQGVSMLARTPTDFASEQMRVSLEDLAGTGANEVLLVVPLKQADLKSCTFFAANETPTLASVATATEMAHAQGLKVILKFHAEVNDQTWRTFINATDRKCWFNNYGTEMLKYLQGVKGIDGAVIGTEQHGMFGTSANPTNAANVRDLVKRLRANFTGQLSYDANHSGDQSDLFDIDWNLFDYGGISCYWPLSDNLTESWNKVLKDYMDPLHKRFPNQDFACTEVGYRSVANGHRQPWDYQVKGAIDYRSQADSYQALFDFLKSRPYLSGVDFWNWRVDYNAQDVNETEFTPQKKLAQSVMTTNFTNQTPAASQLAAAYPTYKALLGAPVAPEMILANGGRGRVYQGGHLYWSPTTGAREVHGLILQKYVQQGGVAAYGLPLTNESKTPDGIGRFNHFQGGRSIYWTPRTGAHAVYGDIRTRWAALAWERGRLGYPTSDEFSVAGGRQVNFERGALYWNAASRSVTVR